MITRIRPRSQTPLMDALRASQVGFIAMRDALESKGLGGASRIPERKLIGGYRVSYNGRVWKGETLILEADGRDARDVVRAALAKAGL